MSFETKHFIEEDGKVLKVTWAVRKTLKGTREVETKTATTWEPAGEAERRGWRGRTQAIGCSRPTHWLRLCKWRFVTDFQQSFAVTCTSHRPSPHSPCMEILFTGILEWWSLAEWCWLPWRKCFQLHFRSFQLVYRKGLVIPNKMNGFK